MHIVQIKGSVFFWKSKAELKRLPKDFFQINYRQPWHKIFRFLLRVYEARGINHIPEVGHHFLCHNLAAILINQLINDSATLVKDSAILIDHAHCLFRLLLVDDLLINLRVNLNHNSQ